MTTEELTPIIPDYVRRALAERKRRSRVYSHLLNCAAFGLMLDVADLGELRDWHHIETLPVTYYHGIPPVPVSIYLRPDGMQVVAVPDGMVTRPRRRAADVTHIIRSWFTDIPF